MRDDVIMWSLQTSIEKSFLYSYSVTETSKQESQRAGDGRDGCFTRMDGKWNSSETTQIRTRLELRSLLQFMTQPLLYNSTMLSCMSVSCIFNLPFPNKAPFHRTPTLIPPKTNLRPISRIAECILFLRSWYKFCDFFEYNWKKQQRTRNPSWPKIFLS